MTLDEDKIDKAALALLSLTLHNGRRVCKRFDWEITERLHQKGLIEDPIGKVKSLSLTDEGLELAQEMLVEFFSTTEENGRHH